MNLSALTGFVLLLTMGLMGVLHEFGRMQKDPQVHVQVIDELRAEVKELRLQNELQEQQMLAFHQEVAEIIPQILKPNDQKEQNFPVRSLASVVQTQETDMLLLQKSKQKFNAGKEAFRQKNYELAISRLEAFVRDYSFSVHMPEVNFLLFESYFQQNRWEDALRVGEKMMRVYPMNELTGFAMIRMGKVYELQSRLEDASDIYQTVLRTFPNRGLASAARESLESLE